MFAFTMYHGSSIPAKVKTRLTIPKATPIEALVFKSAGNLRPPVFLSLTTFHTFQTDRRTVIPMKMSRKLAATQLRANHKLLTSETSTCPHEAGLLHL